MKSWTIPNLDNVVSEYLSDLANIEDNPEDVRSLDDIIFQGPTTNLI